MTNYEIAGILKLYGELLELHGETSFKPKAYSTAAFHIEQLPFELSSLSPGEIALVDGIGNVIAEKIHTIITTRTLPQLEQLIGQTPKGVLEMMELKGFGPKKVAVLWKELGVDNIHDLLIACKENRVCALKGFGAKTQEKLLSTIEYRIAHAGQVLYATAHNSAIKLLEEIKKQVKTSLISLTGEMRRKAEIITKIQVLIGSDEKPLLENFHIAANIPTEIINVSPEEFPYALLTTTGSGAHLGSLNLMGLERSLSEEAIYQANGFSFVPPEMREGIGEIELARNNKIPKLVELSDLKGILHVHTTYSDGAHSLEKMAAYCKELGYEYLGICDHSQAAYYAGGLKPDEVLRQQQEIDELNKKLAPFRIFKGIEADILGDGSLDYSEDILKTFDFVVASVHSNLKMNEEKAMMRLLKAIENPYTTILGHMSGRLLLKRPGYPLDYKKVIDACAANNVIIEVNANPRRLDMDWRWIPYALDKGVKISINPDAHSTGEYHLTYFGVCVARKGGLFKEMTFNSLSADEVAGYFSSKVRKLKS